MGRVKPENKFGFYEGIPLEVYHENNGELSSSSIKAFSTSPTLYEYEFLNGNKKEGPALRFGNYFHSIMEGTLDELYIPESKLPVVDKRTKAGKELWEEIKRSIGNKEIISSEEYEKILKMRENALKEPKLVEYISKSKKELSVYWNEQVGDETIKCRARYDLCTDDGIILDYKTCRDSKKKSFSRNIYEYGYHISSAFYLRGYERVTGKKPKGFIYVACCSVPPYDVYLYQLGDFSIDLGNRIIDKVLKDYVVSVRTKEFKKIAQETMIDIPDWAIKECEMELL